jgi:hypothetical protein
MFILYFKTRTDEISMTEIEDFYYNFSQEWLESRKKEIR